MAFLHLIRDDVCHPEHAALRSGRTLACTVCRTDMIADVYAFFLQPFEDHFQSSALAQAFHAWTGDDRVPLAFPVVDLEGILSKRVVGAPLRQVLDGIRLLRALNAPFTADPGACPPPRETMRGFLGQYLDAVVAHHRSDELSTEQRLMNHIVRGMQQAVQSDAGTDPFDFYFDTLVPYVRNCTTHWTPFPTGPPEENAAKELLIQLQRSDRIRRTFGLYSVPFDAMHAMVASYACSHDLEMVSNWVLDFMARLCRGAYFWKRYPDCVFVKAMQHCLKTDVTRRDHLPLVHVLQHLRRGDAAECLSSQWQPYLQLVGLVEQKFRVRGMAPEVLQMACHQLFPAVAFEHHADQLGFALALAHVVMTADRRSGRVPKGEFKKARHIHDTIRSFVLKVGAFESDRPVIWTLDTLRMFLVSEPHLERDMVSIVQWLLTEDEPDAPMQET